MNSMMTAKEAYERGRDTYEQGVPLECCPWLEWLDLELKYAWLYGYEDARRKDQQGGRRCEERVI